MSAYERLDIIKCQDCGSVLIAYSPESVCRRCHGRDLRALNVHNHKPTTKIQL